MRLWDRETGQPSFVLARQYPNNGLYVNPCWVSGSTGPAAPVGGMARGGGLLRREGHPCDLLSRTRRQVEAVDRVPCVFPLSPLRYGSSGLIRTSGVSMKPRGGAGHPRCREGRSVVVIPVTVFEEIMRLTERGLTKLKMPFHRWAEEVSNAPNFQVQPYTLEILFEAESLSSIRDPADRAIVATARHLGYPLITADEAIQDGEWVETVWD